MPVNYIISLGCSCNVSYQLKKYNLKICSLPFDWIFSNLKMITDIINNNFKDFMDRQYYVPVSIKKVGHKKYHTHLFNHRDPFNYPDYEYYKRCIERFYKILNADEQKLFIHTSYSTLEYTPAYDKLFVAPYDKYKLETVKDFDEFYKFLSTMTKNFIFIIINQIPKSSPHIEKQVKTNNFFIYNLYLRGLTSGTEFEYNEDQDNYKKILDEFSYELLDV